ncbi:Rv0361 family membrane protein [Nocardia brasiliensis]
MTYPNPHQPDQPTGYPPPHYPQAATPAPVPPGARQPSRKSKVGLVIGLIAVVLLALGGVVVIGAVLTAQGKGPFASDAQRIESAIHDFYDTLEKKGFPAAAAKACAADRAEFDALPAEQKLEFDTAAVSVSIDKIDDIKIDGELATARITGKLTLELPGEEPDTDTSTTEHLKKEDGKWKVCSAGSGRN